MNNFRRAGVRQALFLYIIALIMAGTGPAEGFENSLNTVTLRMEWRIKSTGDTARIALTCLIPKNIENRQRVLDINYSTQPVRVFDEGENRYAVFDIAGPAEKEKIVITAKLGIMEHNLQSALALRNSDVGTEKASLTSEEEIQYLTAEKYIQSNHSDIERAAKNIKEPIYLFTPDQTKRQLDLVKKIFNFVVRTLSYAGYNPVDRGAVEGLRAKRGDCSEYSDLFVALCRAKGIPARTAEGFTTESSSVPKHSWAEVFITGLGWVPFDPTFADFKAASFEKMKPIYIYLSRVRNDEILKNFHYFYYHYWGAKPKIKMTYKFSK